MRRSLLTTLLAVSAAGLGLAAPMPTSAAPARPGTVGPTWQVRYNSASAGPGILTSVVALTAGNVWAAGMTNPAVGTPAALVIRWNGSTWATVAVPHASAFGPATVAASSATDVWLFGASSARRWDGQHWHQVSIPQGPTFGDNSPVVLGARDAWTYGVSLNGGCTSTAWHWNGQGWRRSGSFPHLCATGLAGSSARNIWLVGNTATHGKTPTKAFRWNGVKWRAAILPHPYLHSAYTMFPDVAVASKTSVWIGDDVYSQTPPQPPGPGFALHWNGSRWSQSPASALATINGIATDGGGGLWMGPDAEWTGAAWLDTTPGPSFSNGLAYQFMALARVPGSTTIWGVGSMQLSPSGSQYPMLASYG
jgi:hypothetical protein